MPKASHELTQIDLLKKTFLYVCVCDVWRLMSYLGYVGDRSGWPRRSGQERKLSTDTGLLMCLLLKRGRGTTMINPRAFNLNIFRSREKKKMCLENGARISRRPFPCLRLFCPFFSRPVTVTRDALRLSLLSFLFFLFPGGNQILVTLRFPLLRARGKRFTFFIIFCDPPPSPGFRPR